MTITLYKDVELRNDYSLVFDNNAGFWGGKDNTPFYRYLQSKSGITVDVPNIYFANSGNITIDWSYFNSYPTGITYMEIFTETAPNRKYFFVDSYDYNNGMITLYYTMDIWHTYSPSMRLYNGVINRARWGLDLYRYALPISYTSQSTMTFNSIGGTTGKMYIAAEFSVFMLQSGDAIDDSSFRYNYTTLIGRFDRTTTTNDNNAPTLEAPYSIDYRTNFLYTSTEAIEVINRLTAYQGVAPLDGNKDWTPAIGSYDNNVPVEVRDKFDIYQRDITPSIKYSTTLVADYAKVRYEIIQFFLIPENFFNDVGENFRIAMNDGVNTSLTILRSRAKTIGTSPVVNTWQFTTYQFPMLGNYQEQVIRTSMVIPRTNDKLVGYGFHSTYLPHNFNNKRSFIDIGMVFSPIGFSMALITNTGYNDITSYFEVPIPFTTLSATDRQLAALSRQQAKRERIAAIASMAAQGISLAATTVAPAAAAGAVVGKEALTQFKENMGAGFNAATAAAYLPDTMRWSGSGWQSNAWNAAKKKLGKFSVGGFGQAGVGMLYAYNSIANAESKLATPIQAGQANNSVPDALINAKYGFGYYYITPENQEEVNYLVSRVGYDTFIPANDYHHGVDYEELKENYYEPIQFATVNVSGGFSNDVRDVLETILLDGTIIAYDEDVFAQL